MAIVVGIALATAYGADRRADARVAGASDPLGQESEYGPDAGGAVAGAAPVVHPAAAADVTIGE